MSPPIISTVTQGVPGGAIAAPGLSPISSTSSRPSPVTALEAPREIVFNETFNVGDTKENYQVKDVAKTIADTFPGCELVIGDRGGDKRDYKVNFDKINERLPGFSCDWTVAKGAAQLLKIFDRIGMNNELFQAAPFTRLKQIRHLVETKQIDNDFFWTPL